MLFTNASSRPSVRSMLAWFFRGQPSRSTYQGAFDVDQSNVSVTSVPPSTGVELEPPAPSADVGPRDPPALVVLDDRVADPVRHTEAHAGGEPVAQGELAVAAARPSSRVPDPSNTGCMVGSATMSNSCLRVGGDHPRCRDLSLSHDGFLSTLRSAGRPPATRLILPARVGRAANPVRRRPSDRAQRLRRSSGWSNANPASVQGPGNDRAGWSAAASRPARGRRAPAARTSGGSWSGGATRHRAPW